MLNKKYYNVELTTDKAEALKVFLKQNNIYYEPSQCYNLIHFEIKLNEVELDKVNKYLNNL